MRSSKTVGTTKYSFTTLSGLVMRQEWGARQMDFIYDENNQPYALTYKSGKNITPVMYYYLLNQQGDVEALMDTNGAIVATYAYDPWGAVTVKNANGVLDNDDTSIGNMNPLRYRGYYYDNETGFYYLQSRYYDPVVGRFISADSYASTGQGALGCNMFAYCENDPILYFDPCGTYRFIEDFDIADVQNNKKVTGQPKSDSGAVKSGISVEGLNIRITIADDFAMVAFAANTIITSGTEIAFTGYVISAFATAVAATTGGALIGSFVIADLAATTGITVASNMAMLANMISRYNDEGFVIVELYIPSGDNAAIEILVDGCMRIVG